MTTISVITKGANMLISFITWEGGGGTCMLFIIWGVKASCTTVLFISVNVDNYEWLLISRHALLSSKL